MDVAAAGFAAAQIASIQRGQQAALSGIRAQQQQDQSVANLLGQAVSAAKQISGAAPAAPQSAPQSAPASGGSQAAPSGGPTAQRGSLVNILA
jgi:hypothetical protein